MWAGAPHHRCGLSVRFCICTTLPGKHRACPAPAPGLRRLLSASTPRRSTGQKRPVRGTSLISSLRIRTILFFHDGSKNVSRLLRENNQSFKTHKFSNYICKENRKKKKKGGAGAVAMKEASKVSTAEAPNFVFSPSFRQLDLWTVEKKGGREDKERSTWLIFTTQCPNEKRPLGFI